MSFINIFGEVLCEIAPRNKIKTKVDNNATFWHHAYELVFNYLN